MVHSLQTLSKSQITQQKGKTGRTDEGDHVTLMSYEQYENQVRSQDLAQLDECDLSLIESTEAPQFVGAGKGTDNQGLSSRLACVGSH